MAALKIETKITEVAKFVLSDKEKDTLASARNILKEIWADDVPVDDTSQGRYAAIKNPSYAQDPEKYNGMIDAYDAAEVIEFILNSVGFYDEDMCDED